MRYRRKDGPAVDLTGANVYLEMMPVGDGKKVVNSTENGQIIISNPVAGEFVLHLTPDVTDTFTWPKAKYQLNIKFPTGDVFRLMEGTAHIDKKI
jgi:hypothetical protein